MTKHFDVDVVISGDGLDAQTLTDLLIEFVELHGWTMAGIVKPFEDDGENNNEQAEPSNL